MATPSSNAPRQQGQHQKQQRRQAPVRTPGHEEFVRKLSVRSDTAFGMVSELEKKFTSFQDEATQLHEVARDEASTLEDLYKCKQGLAQLAGTLDKFQFESVDAVSTAGLETGKDEVKRHRKALTQEVEKLREFVLELHGHVERITAQPAEETR